MAATLSSNYKRLCPKNFSVAPKEQNVYSPDIPLSLPAPLGAECKLNACKHIALRWSAEPFRVSGYKHRAPLEHFAESRFKPLFGRSHYKPKPHKTTCAESNEVRTNLSPVKRFRRHTHSH